MAARSRPPLLVLLLVAGLLAGLAPLAGAGGALAHPASGIAVDAQGNAWFVDAGEGIWKLDVQGSLSPVPGPPFHWLALDPAGSFLRTKLPRTAKSEMRVVGRDPALVLSSDAPIAIGGDGALYFAEPGADGRLALVRIAPGGVRSVRATLPAETASGPLRWLEGIAAGDGGAILFTDRAAVHRVAPDGALTTVAAGIVVPGCATVPGYREELLPGLRGLARSPDGTIWVAASGCGALLRVSPAGEVAVAMRAEPPWSPTGVAVGPRSVHVLEVRHVAGEGGEAAEISVPRVRELPLAAAGGG